MKDPPDVDSREPDSRGPIRTRRRTAASTDKTGPENAAADHIKKKNGRAKSDATEKEPVDHLNITDLAEDWIALWQHELAALATDRETQENWQALFALWSGAANAWIQAIPFALSRNWARNDGAEQNAARRAKPSATPRPAEQERAAAAPAAPDAHDAEINRLHRSIAELERRLADIERRAGKPATNRRNSGRIGRKR